MITKETIKEHISTVPDEYVAHHQNQEKTPKQRKGKIQTKQKTLINEPISLSNRFSPMDIDPVETITEDSDEATTHIKTDSINLQKRLYKKINIKDNPTENETTNPNPKNVTQATKSRHRSTSRSKEKEKNQKPTPNPPKETKNKLKIEMDSTPTFKKPGELKKKAQAPIGLAGRVNTNSEVFSERPGGTFKLSPAKFDAVPSSSRAKSLMGIDKQSIVQGISKSLERSYSIESMDSDTDRIVASLDLEGITNNYKT